MSDTEDVRRATAISEVDTPLSLPCTKGPRGDSGTLVGGETTSTRDVPSDRPASRSTRDEVHLCRRRLSGRTGEDIPLTSVSTTPGTSRPYPVVVRPSSLRTDQGRGWRLPWVGVPGGPRGVTDLSPTGPGWEPRLGVSFSRSYLFPCSSGLRGSGSLPLPRRETG